LLDKTRKNLFVHRPHEKLMTTMVEIQCQPESELRKQVDPQTITMLDYWHSLCREKVGTELEVVFTDRRNYPFHNISTHVGEENTACPFISGDRVVLTLLIESPKKINPIIVTHEIGHWILKLKGATVLADQNDDIIELGSICSHPALYKLQKSFGHDPKKEIDRKIAHDRRVLPTKIEANSEKTRIKNALYYADDLINCSQNNFTGLESLLSKKLPKTTELVRKILEIAESKDLTKIEEVLPFSKGIVQKLCLTGNWVELDELNNLREQLASLKLKNKTS
jgi:hypothetical protein